MFDIEKTICRLEAIKDIMYLLKSEREKLEDEKDEKSDNEYIVLRCEHGIKTLNNMIEHLNDLIKDIDI